MDNNNQRITGLILAGGRARRMGGIDKGLVDVAGRPLIAWVLDALASQTTEVFINANRSQAEYEAFGYPVIADRIGGFCGPLAGIAAGLEHCATDYLVSCPCDSPLVPPDLVSRLQQQLQADNAEIAVAHNGERLQPVFALIVRSLLASLQTYLDGGGRKIDTWYDQHAMTVADFSDRPEAFININTADDVADFSARLSSQQPNPHEQ